jgi:fibronectin-binding autotransporter adhesin
MNPFVSAPRVTRRTAPALTALAVLACGITAAQAQTWNGAGLSSNWSDRFNWVGSQAPVPSTTTALTFAGGSRLAPVQNITTPFTLNLLTFSANAGAFSLSGNALRLDGVNPRLVQNSSTNMAVLNDVQVATSVMLDGIGSLSLDGNLSRAFDANRDTLVVTKRSLGNLVLTAANSYDATLRIDAGQVQLRHAQALQSASVALNIDNGLSFGTLAQATLGGLSGSGALALGTTKLTVGEANRDTRYTGVLTGGFGSWLTKKGTGTLTLAGTGSQLSSLVVESGGALMLDGGSLALTSLYALASGPERSALSLNAGGRLEVRNGARLDANGNGRSSVFLDGDANTELLIDGTGSRVNTGFQTIVGLSDRGRITVRNGGNLEARDYLMAGYQDGSNGTITLESGGRATASYTGLGVTTGSVGTLVASGAGSQLVTTGELGLGGIGAGSSQQGGTGRLQVRAGALAQAAQTRFWTAASSIEIDGGSLVTGGLISGAGAGSITLTPSVQSNAPELTLNAGAGSFSYGGSISGDGGLLKTGASTQVLDGRNSFTGLVQVQGGTLQLSSSDAAEYEVAGGGSLRLGERNLGAAVVQVLTGGQVVYTNTTLNGGLLMGPGNHDISAVQRMVGTRVAGGAALTPATGATFVGVVNDGQINNASGRSLTWTGGSNASGAFVVGGAASVSNFSSGGQIQVVAGGSLVSTSGNLALGGGSRTTVGSVGQPGGTVELRAGGRLQLSGGLLVNNGRIVGPLEVNFGGMAKGAGEFGVVTVNDGGRFSPGNSPGSVTTGDTAWGGGGNLLVELADARGAAGLDWDLWNIQGGLSVQSGTTANSQFMVSLATLDGSNQAAPLAGFDASRAWQWLIVDTQAGIQGFDTARVALDTRGFLSPLAGGTLQLAVQGGDLYLQFAPVPEPRTWALMLGGLGVLCWAARRRRAG